MQEQRPIRILIAALGGEGGGVLAGWITQAATASGLVASRTSIPGVAQRTGATTYYIEIAQPSADGRPPVLALNPAPGEVDLLLASELLEAARMAQAGFVSPDRTTLVASTHRVYSIAERMAMGDGRLDSARLVHVLRGTARHAILDDYDATAKAAGAPLSAVLLGAIARSGVLPMTADVLRAAIRAEGKSVAANTAGFEAGFAAPALPAGTPRRAEAWSPGTDEIAAGLDRFPSGTHETLGLGYARLADYQDEAYARLYLDRVARFLALPGADADILTRLARHLAVRMSFEDTIRVAQLKLRAARIARVRAEAKAAPGDIVDVTEFLKPGPEEILSLLPPAPARRLLAFIERRGWMSKAFPMKVRTTRPGGMLRLRLLASQRRRRRNTLRFHEENAWVEQWLALVQATLAVDPQAARQVVETARLVRGYGDTYKRGAANWLAIVREIVEPGIAGALPGPLLADAILQARIAAEKDPEGDALHRTIAAIRAHAAPRAVAAQ